MTDIYSTPNYLSGGLHKFARLNWILLICVLVLASIGFIIQYSVSGGSLRPWALPHLQRFGIGFIVMIIVAIIPIKIWQRLSIPAYVSSIILLVLLMYLSVEGTGAQRWIVLGSINIQPSEIAKISIVMLLAAYYDRLDPRKVSHPFWLIAPAILIMIPAYLVLQQPDLGTAVLLVLNGGIVMFVAGVNIFYYVFIGLLVIAIVAIAIISRGTTWQLLKDYQYQRIDTFFNPDMDPLGAGYHIIQAKIALGSGGIFGRGFTNGTQSQLNFLPEKHTDFVFSTLAEEFGLIWGLLLLMFYCIVIAVCIFITLRSKSRFQSLLVIGIGGVFFSYFALNIAMVVGFAPVVGVPLPFISYGGSAILTQLFAFGLIQSAYIHNS